MKKTVSILLSMCFVASLNAGVVAFAKTPTATKKVAKVVAKTAVKAKEVSAKGAVRKFTDKTVTIVVGGKDVTYKIAATTKVIQNDTPVAFLDAVQKGVYVTFKYNTATNTITTINIPNAGAFGQGDVKMKLVDINVAMTDSNLGVSSPKVNAGFFVKSESQVREATGQEPSDSFIMGNDSNFDTNTGDADAVVLGALEVVENTVKVNLDGKDLKVVTGVTCDRNDDGKIISYTLNGKEATIDQIFDKTTIGDECAIVNDVWYGVYLVKFEKNVYDDETKYSVEDLEKRLKLTYDKKTFKITTYQITEFPMNDDVVCELNGQTASLAKVLNRSNYSMVTTNLAGEIIFINGYYRDFTVRVDSVKGNKINFSKLVLDTDAKSPVKFSDSVSLSDGLTVQASTGAPLEISDIKAGDMIKITVEQDDNYRVTLIEKIVK